MTRIRALLESGDLDAALAAFGQEAEAAEAAQDTAGVVRCLIEQANILRRLGRLEEGSALAERAGVLAQSLNDPVLRQAVCAGRAAAFWQLGDVERADQLFLEQWQLSRDAGIEVGLRNAFHNLLDLRRSREDVDALVALFALQWDVRSIVGEPEDDLLESMAGLASDLESRRNVDGSLKLLEAAEQLARSAGDLRRAGNLLDKRIRMTTGRQDLEGALALTSELQQLARDAQLDQITVGALVMRAALLAISDDSSGALEAREEAERTARAMEDRSWLLYVFVQRSKYRFIDPAVFALKDEELREARDLAMELDSRDAYAQLHWPQPRDFSPSHQSVPLGVGRTLELDDLRQRRDGAMKREKYRVALFFCEALSSARGHELGFDDWSAEGFCHERLHGYEAAVTAYQRALRLDEARPEAQANLAICLLRLDRLSEALKAARAVLEAEPSSAALWCDLAQALLERARSYPELAARGISALRLGVASVPASELPPMPDPETGELWPASALMERYRTPLMDPAEIVAPWQDPPTRPMREPECDIAATPCGPLGQPAWPKGWPLWTPLGDERAERLRGSWLREVAEPVLGGELEVDSLLLLLEWQEARPMGFGGVYPAVGAFSAADEVCAFLLYAAIPLSIAEQWDEVADDFDLVREACNAGQPEEIRRLRALLESLWQCVQHPDVALERLPQLIREANALCGAHSQTKVGGWNGFEVRRVGTAAEIMADSEILAELRERADEYEDLDAARLVDLADAGAFDPRSQEHRALLLGYFEQACEARSY